MRSISDQGLVSSAFFSVSFSGQAIGAGSLIYRRVEDVVAAVNRALADDFWLDSERQDAKRVGGVDIHRLKREIVDMEFLFGYVCHQISCASHTVCGLVGFHNDDGPISAAEATAIFSFLYVPCARTWADAADIVVLGGRNTLWSVWISYDPLAPKRIGYGDKWQTWPDPKLLIFHANTLIQERLLVLKKKQYQLRLRIERLKNAVRERS